MKFVKMHGCGNDYVYLDAVREPRIEDLLTRDDWGATVRRMSDRHKGIGSDGVIVLCPPTAAASPHNAHVRMRMFNADGSESEMCGNGVRCVAKFAHDRLNMRADPLQVETGRGVLAIQYKLKNGSVTEASVDMGEPILELPRIPVRRDELDPILNRPDEWRVRGFNAGDGAWRFVSMGNPHAIYLESMGPWFASGFEERGDSRRMLTEWGSLVERLPAFPNRTNVHLLNVVAQDRLDVFTWERGAGITQACGTGVCAAVVAAAQSGLTSRDVQVRVLGGDLQVRWDAASHHIFLTGEAVDVFEGVWAEP